VTGKIDLSLRETAWLPELSSIKEPIISAGGYPLTLAGFIYLGLALYFGMKGLHAPGNPVIWKLSTTGLILESIAGLFAALAIVPRKGVSKEYQILRAAYFIITHPLDVIPESSKKEVEKNKKKKPKEKKKKDKKQNENNKKKNTKKESKRKENKSAKEKKQVKTIKFPWGDSNDKE